MVRSVSIDNPRDSTSNESNLKCQRLEAELKSLSGVISEVRRECENFDGKTVGRLKELLAQPGFHMTTSKLIEVTSKEIRTPIRTSMRRSHPRT